MGNSLGDGDEGVVVNGLLLGQNERGQATKFKAESLGELAGERDAEGAHLFGACAIAETSPRQFDSFEDGQAWVRSITDQ